MGVRVLRDTELYMVAESRKERDWLRIVLVVVALAYAFLAGFHTVDDLDLGWQMATARYILQHHHFPSTTLFNYTVPEHTFLYPAFSGIVFYLIYLVGGYAALSWFRAVACAGTVGLLVRGGGKANAALAILAVPAIMFRENLRADLFSVVLFAALLGGLWRYYTGEPFGLWLLPVCLFLWANLHPGFIFGFGLLGGYVLFEVCDLFFPERRAAALERLRKAAPWIVASIPATLINPWGWRLYEAVLRQGKLTAFQTAFVTEWSGAQFNGQALRQALNPRDPVSGEWWLMGLGALTILAFIWKKRFGPAIFVTAMLFVSIQHVRFRAVYAVTVAILVGAALQDLAEVAWRAWARLLKHGNEAEAREKSRVVSVPALAATALLVALTGVRVLDLVSNRYYTNGLPMALFGTGLSWWFPEKAASFLLDNQLPGNVFHDFNVGGYLVWRIGEQYPDFSDGRVIPFADGIMDEQLRIQGLAPDSPELKEASDRWNLQTMLFSISPYVGLGSFPLQQYCQSENWKLVYMDDVSVIFLRNTLENAAVIARSGADCRTVRFVPPSAAVGDSLRAKGEQFHFLLNTSSIFFVLERDAEAWANLKEAEALFPQVATLHLLKAQLLMAENRTKEAEDEYLQIVRKDPCDECWYALARLYAGEKRYGEAEHALKEAESVSLVPYERMRSLGQLYLLMNQPKTALESFSRAEAASPYGGVAADHGKRFRAQIAEGRARAYRQLNDLGRAVAEQTMAVELEPGNAARWRVLAELYQAQGKKEKAAEARAKAGGIEKK